jgi:hypothetical protein
VSTRGILKPRVSPAGRRGSLHWAKWSCVPKSARAVRRVSRTTRHVTSRPAMSRHDQLCYVTTSSFLPRHATLQHTKIPWLVPCSSHFWQGAPSAINFTMHAMHGSSHFPLTFDLSILPSRSHFVFSPGPLAIHFPSRSHCVSFHLCIWGTFGVRLGCIWRALRGYRHSRTTRVSDAAVALWVGVRRRQRHGRAHRQSAEESHPVSEPYTHHVPMKYPACGRSL